MGAWGMNRFTIVHISDIDLTMDDNQRLATQPLQRIFDDLEDHQVAADLIVLSGDLLIDGDQQGYRQLHQYLQQQERRLQVTIQVLLGDRDDREAFNRGYLAVAHQPYYVDKQVHQNMDFYFLDSKWELNKSAGWLDRPQLDWLNKNLHLAPRRRAFIFLHHPLDAPALRDMRYTLLQNNRELLAILHGHNIGGIFTGHLHFDANYVVDSVVPVTVTGSAATYINCQDPYQHDVYTGTTYNVITIQRGIASVITHPLALGQTVIQTIPVNRTGFVKHRPRAIPVRRPLP